jgi:biotin carboxylase
LLENSDVDLDFYYVSPGIPLALPIPEHDALIVAIGEADENCDLCRSGASIGRLAEARLNAPQHIPENRTRCCQCAIAKRSGLCSSRQPCVPRVPHCRPLERAPRASELFDGCDFPIIVRPVGSHGGAGSRQI